MEITHKIADDTVIKITNLVSNSSGLKMNIKKMGVMVTCKSNEPRCNI